MDRSAPTAGALYPIGDHSRLLLSGKPITDCGENATENQPGLFSRRAAIARAGANCKGHIDAGGSSGWRAGHQGIRSTMTPSVIKTAKGKYEPNRE
jgi:hypothetical protein